MKLEHFINESIYSYPTLYRSFNHEMSRFHVLGHIFISYGTALEWHKDGYLTYDAAEESPKEGLEALPDNFYEMDLWYIDVPEERIEELEEELKGSFYYYKEGYQQGNKCCIFSTDKERAQNLTERFEAVNSFSKRLKVSGIKIKLYANEASSYERAHSEDTTNSIFYEKFYLKGYRPSRMCKYSPIVEMVENRTNSTHIDNFNLVNVHPDWIQGALEISRYCLDWYRNKDNYKYMGEYPPNNIKGMKEFYDKDPLEYRKGCDGTYPGAIFTDDMTVEDYCEANWIYLLAEQIGYFEKLIEMYE